MKLGEYCLRSLFQSNIWEAHRGSEKLTVDNLHFNPNSIDVTLHHKFLKPSSKLEYVDPLAETTQIEYTAYEGPYILMPGEFVLGAVTERFDCSKPIYTVMCPTMVKCAPMYEGRSTCGRLGIASHITAGFGDYNFSGCFTLELYNHAPYPILLTPGMRIGQVAFEIIIQPGVYEGAYSKDHNDGPVAPRLGSSRFK